MRTALSGPRIEPGTTQLANNLILKIGPVFALHHKAKGATFMKLIIFAIILGLFSTSCNKSSDSGSNSTQTHSYALRNGSCYDYTSSTYVTNSNCQGNNGSYYMSNNTCYNQAGQVVDTQNCNNQNNGGYYDNNGNWVNGNNNGNNNGSNNGNGNCNGGNYNGGYSGGGGTCSNRPCYGNYIFTQGGFMQYGMCYGINCRGYTLIDASSGRTVRCE